VGHSIEYSTADLDFYFLSVPFSGLELRSDDAFKPRHRGLDQRPAMIPTLLFPLFPTDFSHAGYSLIARLDMPVTSFAFFIWAGSHGGMIASMGDCCAVGG
jgi:hypothetical protein